PPPPGRPAPRTPCLLVPASSREDRRPAAIDQDVPGRTVTSRALRDPPDAANGGIQEIQRMSDHSELPAWVLQARAGWVWRGAGRPPFAVEPGLGEESVWDYPRPPLLVRDTRHVVVRLGSIVVAESRSALRLLETSH